MNQTKQRNASAFNDDKFASWNGMKESNVTSSSADVPEIKFPVNYILTDSVSYIAMANPTVRTMSNGRRSLVYHIVEVCREYYGRSVIVLGTRAESGQSENRN